MNSEAVTDFADFLRGRDVAALRVALHYEGDEYEPVLVREDVDDPAHGLRSPGLEDEDEALAAAEEHFGG